MSTTADPLAGLEAATRLVLDADLEPVIGSTFQPTGFPNLGAATFERPGHEPMLLVESVQSLINHVEAAGWDAPAQRPVEALAGLPYLVVRADDGDFLTSSRLEPHRLAAAYVRDAEIDGQRGIAWLAERLELEEGRPLNWPRIYRQVYELDPLCLIHGVFFSDREFHGNPKVRRALTLVLEAHDAREAVSGGLKRDDVAFKVDREGGQGAEEGYGFVPFGRTEFAAARLQLSASLDLGQLRGYGLPEPATRLLALVALWELSTLLDTPLRLRTRCDLEVTEVRVRRPSGFELASPAALAAAIAASGAEFEQAEPRELVWRGPRPRKR